MMQPLSQANSFVPCGADNIVEWYDKFGTVEGLMRRVMKWALGLVVVLAIISLFWEPLIAQKEAAPAAHAYNVQIVRDEYGVPHIKGKTDADASYGLAYAHAEDDFSTIDDARAGGCDARPRRGKDRLC
jgi:hypothetical protein